MTVRVKDILECLNIEAPFKLAESWDNVGLLVGSQEQQVTAVLAGLDPTCNLIDEAIAKKANTIITHHPVIFKPLTSIDTSRPDGRLLAKALANGIAIIGCHTNFDSASEGVSDYLAQQLGLEKLSPLLPTPGSERADIGLGRVGSYSRPVPFEQFLPRLLATLELPAVQIAGPAPTEITTVAVCGGSGSDLAPLALEQGVDVYLSAEIKHSTAVWARENGFCIIDGTHYATEKPAVTLLVDKLRKCCDRKGLNIKILQTTREQHPFVLTDNNTYTSKKHSA